MKKLKSSQSFFTLADEMSYHQRVSFGIGIDDFRLKSQIKAKPTGEFREPKKDEWYLSGAEIQAYRAKNPLTTKYFIAKLVKVETKTIVTETEIL